MQPADPVLVETTGGVGVLTLNEPDRRNPLSPAVVDALTQSLRRLADDGTCRAVVLRGAGRGFCAGADLTRMRAASALEDRDEYNAILMLNKTLWGYRKPTVAAVHGFALGAGCNLMNWCDVAIVEDDVRLGFPEVIAGVPSATVIPTLLRTVGRKATMEFVLSGAKIDPARAERLGLVNRVVGRGEAFGAAMEFAGTVAAHDPSAVQLTKDIVRAVSDMSYEQGIEYAKEVRVVARMAPDFGVRIRQGGTPDTAGVSRP
ncbi:enoyl-CoA hydratase/isomerase family protein [Amycolatopsis alkalitolerans]|uniref:Enoyl-CoA hydratase/isomerase family protein n=1 Tax=Amycolatopsis alkalitolerans TaxID=2547244 RepID=A0A5C4MCQ4_9PSEU|nr:enoyl-CoA hydratase/isomerase family protein [Amycolatopsis alkalitolerans]TNC29222.1 enoyl-CoA hydratase/isomerase family protein [Amycolatopsis alkalitolerans]